MNRATTKAKPPLMQSPPIKSRASHVHVQVGLIEVQVEILQPLAGNPRLFDFFLVGAEFFEVPVFQNHDKPGGGLEF